MCTGNPVQHHESGTKRRNSPLGSQRPRCVISKEPRPSHDDRRRGINISGVDFWHAVEFSRNGRFLCTHPLGLSSGRFPSVLRFRLYQIFPIRFPRCFPGSRFRVSLSGGSDSIRSFLDLIPSQRGLSSRPWGRSDVSNLCGSARRVPIGSRADPVKIDESHSN